MALRAVDSEGVPTAKSPFEQAPRPLAQLGTPAAPARWILPLPMGMPTSPSTTRRISRPRRTIPAGFVANLPAKVVLDEVQPAPELFLALKSAVDRERAPGRFILTGSLNVLLLPRLADSLAGRMEILRLHPLSQCELARARSGFAVPVPALWEAGQATGARTGRK